MLWFGSNWKWFILLLLVLPAQVGRVIKVEQDHIDDQIRVIQTSYPMGASFTEEQFKASVEKKIAPLEKKKEDLANSVNTSWGMIFTIGVIWAAFGPTIFGGWSDRIRRRKPFIAIGMVLTVCALFLLSRADSLVLIAACYLMLQISDDVMQGAYASLIPQVVPKDKQSKSSAVLSAANLFAQIFSALSYMLIGGVAILGLSPNEKVYYLIILVNVISAALVLYTIKDLEEPEELPETNAASEKSSFLQDILAPWKSRDFRWVWGSRFLIMLGFFIIQPYMLNFLKDLVGIPGDKGSLHFSLFGLDIASPEMAQAVILLSLSLAGGIGALLSIKRMPIWGLKKTIWMCGYLLAPVLLGLAFARDFSLIWVLAIGFGFAHGTFLSADWALGAAVVPDPESLGKDMGIWSSAVVFAQLISGLAGSLIDQLNKVNNGLGYALIFVASAIFMGFGTQLVRQVRGAS